MLDKNDEKTIGKIVEKVSVKVVCEALEQIVLPQLQEIRNDIAVFKSENKKEHKNMREDIDDLKDTSTRIELGSRSIAKRQDGQGDQIIKINKVLKLEPKV